MEFKDAYIELIGDEGGYVNDPDDSGGETYKGISRRYNPDWTGWNLIDNYKENKENFKDFLKTDDNLEALVQAYYKANYWHKFKGEELPYIVAEELFEQSVNLGTWKTAGINLQKALNLLNRNGKLFKDLLVDGLVGPTTLKTVKLVKSRRLLKVLNGLQFMRYYELDTKNPTLEKYVGWFDRT